jgi:sulfite exporter TauE/SafE
MDTIFLAALLTGLIGSLHCLGMCGPIVLMLPVGTASKGEFLLSRLTYNLGRVITYAILGAICGLLGHLIILAGYQQVLSIAVGIVILLAFIIPRRFFRKISPSFVNNLTDKLTGLWGKLLNSPKAISLFVIGLLNGLLPCGLVYVALAAASTTGNAVNGSLYMIVFGLGTIPLMLIFSLFSGLLPNKIRLWAPKLIPIAAMALAILLILRGLSLGIPYISPNLQSHSKKITQQSPLESPLKHDCCK